MERRRKVVLKRAGVKRNCRRPNHKVQRYTYNKIEIFILYKLSITLTQNNSKTNGMETPKVIDTSLGTSVSKQ